MRPESIEARLRQLEPTAPSAETDAAILAAVQGRRARRLHRWRGAAGLAAAALALVIVWPRPSERAGGPRPAIADADQHSEAPAHPAPSRRPQPGRPAQPGPQPGSKRPIRPTQPRSMTSYRIEARADRELTIGAVRETSRELVIELLPSGPEAGPVTIKARRGLKLVFLSGELKLPTPAPPLRVKPRGRVLTSVPAGSKLAERLRGATVRRP